METQATTNNNLEDDNFERYILESSMRTIKTRALQMIGHWVILVWKPDLCSNPVTLHNILLGPNFWKSFKCFTELRAVDS